MQVLPVSGPGAHVTTVGVTDGRVQAFCDFYTWREAILQANEVASRFTTADKPRVFWSIDRWVLRYHYRPMAMNA